MLLRPEATFIDEATNRAERIFPRGTQWLSFESMLPGETVFENSVLEPAVGVTGELALKTFATADWQNWLSTTKISVFELGTRIGLPELEGTPLARGVSHVFSTLDTSVNIIKQFDDPAELVPELLKNAGLQVIQQLSSHTGMIGQTVAQVLAAAVWAADVIAAHINAELAKYVPLPPLQTEDPATDTWQANRAFEVIRARGTGGVVFPDGGVEVASNADYTKLFLPAYRSEQPWQIQHRTGGVAAQQGRPTEARGPAGETQYNFDPGSVDTFGFMPGTTTTLRVLQASYRFYQSVRGTAIDRYGLRCEGVDKPCYQTTKSFDGRRDCRQCVKAESVWPQVGLGWAYGGAPLNATTPGENVGAFYPSTNKLLLNLLDMIARPGPLLYTVDTERMYEHWKRSFEKFWEFAAAEWRRHDASGWRGLISRLATIMTTYDDEDGDPQLGGRDPSMPLDAIASPREAQFSVPFSRSIFSDSSMSG